MVVAAYSDPSDSRPILWIWAGPVSGAEIASVHWTHPTKVLVVGKGIGDAKNPLSSTAFSNLGASLPSPRVHSLISRAGLHVGDYRMIGIGGFSAAHGLIDHILRDPPSVNAISALGAFDAYYGSAVKPGYLSFCKRALQGDSKLAFLSSSDSADPVVGSAAKGIAPLALQLGLVPCSVSFEGLNGPDWAECQGNVTHAHFSAYPHPQQAKVVAPAVIEQLISPWMAGIGRNTVDKGSSLLKFILGLAAGGGLAWAASSAIQKWVK